MEEPNSSEEEEEEKGVSPEVNNFMQRAGLTPVPHDAKSLPSEKKQQLNSP